uniref:Uncharacterized protein n=1 Tax=Setaria digitata TaxID=48799 RepID=A0A915PMA0_9BILA
MTRTCQLLMIIDLRGECSTILLKNFVIVKDEDIIRRSMAIFPPNAVASRHVKERRHAAAIAAIAGSEKKA